MIAYNLLKPWPIGDQGLYFCVCQEAIVEQEVRSFMVRPVFWVNQTIWRYRNTNDVPHLKTKSLFVVNLVAVDDVLYVPISVNNLTVQLTGNNKIRCRGNVAYNLLDSADCIEINRWAVSLDQHPRNARSSLGASNRSQWTRRHLF